MSPNPPGRRQGRLDGLPFATHDWAARYWDSHAYTRAVERWADEGCSKKRPSRHGPSAPEMGGALQMVAQQPRGHTGTRSGRVQPAPASALGDTHHMGARMLLAMAATATQGRDRDASASVLGMDVDDAAALAAALPQTLHPAVASAAALWTRALFDTPALRSWRSRQPESVVQGDMPSQADADEWARCTTLGLLDRFPVTIGYDW